MKSSFNPRVLLTSLSLFVALAIFQGLYPTNTWESKLSNLARFQQAIDQSHWLYQIADAVSYSIYPFIALVAIWLAVTMHKRTHSMGWIGVWAIISIFMVDLLKIAFNRDRPLIIDDIPSIAASSFPSSHTYASLILILALHQSTRSVLWRSILWIYPIIMAWSRMVVYAHHPTDVIASFFLALAVWQVLLWSESKAAK